MATSAAPPTTPTASSLQLDPPAFTVDEDNQDVELWTFRLPVGVPLGALKDVQLKLNGEPTTFTANGKEYKIQLGDADETETFRVLVPNDDESKEDKDKDKNDDSSSSSSSSSDGEDDNNEDKKGTLRPSNKAFSKHFQVLASVPVLTESQVAPREGPTPADKMRHAYAPVAQRTGLKRRWMPMGVPSNPVEEEQERRSKKRTTSTAQKNANHDRQPTDNAVAKNEPQSSKRKHESSDDSDASSEDNKKLSKAERKAKKAEKKAAKKAKKEAKKAKKAAKKAKKN